MPALHDGADLVAESHEAAQHAHAHLRTRIYQKKSPHISLDCLSILHAKSVCATAGTHLKRNTRRNNEVAVGDPLLEQKAAKFLIHQNFPVSLTIFRRSNSALTFTFSAGWRTAAPTRSVPQLAHPYLHPYLRPYPHLFLGLPRHLYRPARLRIRRYVWQVSGSSPGGTWTGSPIIIVVVHYSRDHRAI